MAGLTFRSVLNVEVRDLPRRFCSLWYSQSRCISWHRQLEAGTAVRLAEILTQAISAWMSSITLSTRLVTMVASSTDSPASSDAQIIVGLIIRVCRNSCRLCHFCAFFVLLPVDGCDTRAYIGAIAQCGYVADEVSGSCAVRCGNARVRGDAAFHRPAPGGNLSAPLPGLGATLSRCRLSSALHLRLRQTVNETPPIRTASRVHCIWCGATDRSTVSKSSGGAQAMHSTDSYNSQPDNNQDCSDTLTSQTRHSSSISICKTSFLGGHNTANSPLLYSPP